MPNIDARGWTVRAYTRSAEGQAAHNSRMPVMCAGIGNSTSTALVRGSDEAVPLVRPAPSRWRIGCCAERPIRSLPDWRGDAGSRRAAARRPRRSAGGRTAAASRGRRSRLTGFSRGREVDAGFDHSVLVEMIVYLDRYPIPTCTSAELTCLCYAPSCRPARAASSRGKLAARLPSDARLEQPCPYAL